METWTADWLGERPKVPVYPLCRVTMELSLKLRWFDLSLTTLAAHRSLDSTIPLPALMTPAGIKLLSDLGQMTTKVSSFFPSF